MLAESKKIKMIETLQELLGDRVTTNVSLCEQHGKDESWHRCQPPDMVCFVESEEEVATILRLCHQERVPVIPFGTGTGMEGQVTALTGGVCIDLSRLNQILKVNQQDFDCTVQAGVTRKQLNQHLRDSGLFFSVDPGADASIGGMAATRASGTTSVRYGTMSENVISLKVALPDGRVIKTANRARKSAAGLDLTHLFVGSEGILGVILEVTVRLHPQPERVAAARVHFETIEDAVNTVSLALQHAIPLARMELVDATQMNAINRYSSTAYPAKATLFLEFHGSEVGVSEEAKLFADLVAEFNGSDFQWTANTEERNQLWSARHDAAYAAMAMRPGARAFATDVCVPLSRFSQCILETLEDVDAHCTVTTMLVGHVGDGNFHLVFLVDPDSSKELEEVETVHKRLVRRALSMQGTCTGEHGIGIGKQQYLVEEFGRAAVDTMIAVKQAIDPHGIMNPGKKLPIENAIQKKNSRE